MIDYDLFRDVRQIIYDTLSEYDEGEYMSSDLYFVVSEEIAERVLDYLMASEGIPV